MKTLVDQEFEDTGYDELFRECRKFNCFGRDRAIYAISMIAAVYLRHRHHWREFQSAHGIALKPRRGPTARSIFQPMCRHLLGLDEGGDPTGSASIWAKILDEWVERDLGVAAIPTWIADRGGIREIYDGEDGPKTHPAQNDIVFTADPLAARIVAHLPIGPTDFCVDPCRGRGAFYKALPEGRRDWCELKEGRNFLTHEFNRHISWIATNPPFSDAYLDIAARSFTISDNVVFLVKLAVAISTYARHRAWRRAGHNLREIIYIRWEDAGFLTEDGTEKLAEGFVLAALWWQRHWTGGIWETDWTEGEDRKLQSLLVPAAPLCGGFL
jgi:hypothetical protein